MIVIAITKSSADEAESLRAILNFLSDLYSSDCGTGVQTGNHPQDEALPPLETTTSFQSLAGKIEEVCKQYTDDQWTMGRMLKHLRRIKFPMSPTPQGSISAALGKLAKSGKLKVLRQGSGRMASIYQWASDEIDQAKAREATLAS